MVLFMMSLILAQPAWDAPITAAPLAQVQITDEFWTPKRTIWQKVTIPDCFDKFEKTGAFTNFDRVCSGQRGDHQGPPWYDGLIYEMIRAAADFLASSPDPALQARLDAYIERIAAAAEKDPDGYIETYTLLMEPDHRWGLNGGYERIAHEVYNAGALMEAGAHYYLATGQTRLLRVAVRMANLMYKTMGPAPKRNIVPSHPLSEEAAVDLYRLFVAHPEVKQHLDAPVDETEYLRLAEFWLEARGHHCGQPDWEKQSEVDCQKFIRDKGYGEDRPSWGSYAQDHKPLLEQSTIEGHAVRATLLCAGLAAAAVADRRSDYAETAQTLWTNMVDKKMHITGGVGAFATDEKFGPDYVLPNNAYLETCAAVGAGFFHENMFLLYKAGRYIDELERVLYNGVLSGISLEGNRYYYENPLEATNRNRWEWHSCPCCPPMFLKIMAALPGYIYATDKDGVYVNLFIGSRFTFEQGGVPVTVTQQTRYPWDGKVGLTVDANSPTAFQLRVRIPNWSEAVTFNLNGEACAQVPVVNGFAVWNREWKDGDLITFEIPLPVRTVFAHPNVEANSGRAALMRGPLVYCVESADNRFSLKRCILPTGMSFTTLFHPELLGGITAITGKAGEVRDWTEEALYRNRPADSVPVDIVAIPFYANSNREPGDLMVWLRTR